MKDIISINDLSKQQILEILDLAHNLENMSKEDKLQILTGEIVSTLFFEPSTRTCMSFESAAMRLGAKVLRFPPLEQSSVKKGETFVDTIRIVEGYCDVMVIRHPHDGAARLASASTDVHVINAGDGSNQHPSQTLLDLYTIQKERGSLDNLTIAFVGDLKYGRTVHSLLEALRNFSNVKMLFIAPQMLQIPPYLLAELDESGVKYEVLDDFRTCLDQIDVFYMTRIQRERFPDDEDYEKVKGVYVINRDNILGKCKDNMIILHPLPRVDEISTDLDDTKHALYFKQAKNGVPIRQAMIMTVLGKKLPTTK